jgi:uncharacterized protein (DUF2141 family)
MNYFWILIAAWIGTQQPAIEANLTVIIENIQPKKGEIKICLFDNETDFLKRAIICREVKSPAGSIVTVSFQVIVNYEYAVSVYHDLNSNGRLDRNLLGIPVEPYGFSNNPSTRFGPPGFKKAKFLLADTLSITIHL